MGLENYNANVHVYDPWVNKGEVKKELGLDVIDKLVKGKYDAIIFAVSHSEFTELGAEGIHRLGATKHVLYDIKYILPSDDVDGRL